MVASPPSVRRAAVVQADAVGQRGGVNDDGAGEIVIAGDGADGVNISEAKDAERKNQRGGDEQQWA